jgi:hypothetical protein
MRSRLFGRQSRKREIAISLILIYCMNCIELSRDGIHWVSLLNTAVTFLFPEGWSFIDRVNKYEACNRSCIRPTEVDTLCVDRSH